MTIFALLLALLQAPAPASVTTVMTITMPATDATLEVDGVVVPGAGISRTYETPPLAINRNYKYSVVAKWRPNGYTDISRTKVVAFRAGQRLILDLASDDPADRVVVRFVPTPDNIALAMVKLAGVTSSDVTYEPGVGDARITIAAVKAGAQRAVGIDLDPERAKESRANVAKAGLGDRIEIRLGARVVSHRFLMGDWTPDKTITINDEYGLPYEVHLWTITEAHTRR